MHPLLVVLIKIIFARFVMHLFIAMKILHTMRTRPIKQDQSVKVIRYGPDVTISSKQFFLTFLAS